MISQEEFTVIHTLKAQGHSTRSFRFAPSAILSGLDSFRKPFQFRKIQALFFLLFSLLLGRVGFWGITHGFSIVEDSFKYFFNVYLLIVFLE